ncbi:MAG: hypothetical protein P4L42_17720 [Desulfocapsaceae bacterium]|nr:hypothetical protein [Desulfocapsaceae bacterium]
MIKNITNLLEQMIQKHPGILVAAVVTIEDGMSIAEMGRHPEIDTAAVSAYLASIVKSNSKAIGLLAESRESDDLLITTNKYHFVIRRMADLPIFTFYMTTKEKWLAIADTLMQ